MPCQFLTHTMSETRSAGPFLCLDKCLFCPHDCVLYDSHTQATKKGQTCKMLLLYPDLDSKVQGAHNGNVCCLHRLIPSCGSTNHDQSEEETAHLRSNLGFIPHSPCFSFLIYLSVSPALSCFSLNQLLVLFLFHHHPLTPIHRLTL